MKKVIPSGAVLIPDQAERVFEGKIFDVYQWPQKMFDGSTETFEMLKRPDTVKVICVVEGKLLLLNEEQPNQQAHQSFPGGRIDPGDADVMAAARREVLEETGYGFKNWRLIKVWQPQVKIEWFVYLLVAWDEADRQVPSLDVGEKITLQAVAFDELKELVAGSSGHLGESAGIFNAAGSLEQLLASPEFQGREVDR